jgi:hypothetical protein
MILRLPRAGGLAVAVLGGAVACGTIAEEPSVTPQNACPAHACERYVQEGMAPSCTAGVCTVAEIPQGLLLVIGLPTDSYLSPGRTYLATLGGNSPLSTGACGLPACTAPLCMLPEWVEDVGSYAITPSAAVPTGWYLGNPGQPTALPVQASYRRLYGSPPQDVADLGLPVEPVLARNVLFPVGNPGPNGSQPLQFQAYLQGGCYERTLAPLSPLSSAFPPEIKTWTTRRNDPPLLDFETTREETGLPNGLTKIVPTFEITRAEGLDGWTAYLREVATKRVFSNVAPLHGSLAKSVVLPTNHLESSTGDALTGLALVIAPPEGTPLPTEVLAPTGIPGAVELPARETYPSMPTPVTLSGTVGTAAEIVFTALEIHDRFGQRFPPNFEFVGHATTHPDARGLATYSVLLPQGRYQIAVRPTDSAHAVTVVTRTVGMQGNEMTDQDVVVESLILVKGKAMVADGRLLANAVVEALPTGCAAGVEPDPSGRVSDACLPRSAQTLTLDDGSFSLAVDRGSYILRVRPAEGSRLPWVRQAIVVGAQELDLVDPVVVPAPVRVAMRLTDSAGASQQNALANVVVRVFTDPLQGGIAIELGRAITDFDGNYEMFLAPLAP